MWNADPAHDQRRTALDDVPTPTDLKVHDPDSRVAVWVAVQHRATPCRYVAERGQAEGIDEAIVAKVRSAIVLFRPLLASENVEIRLHGTILYNSIYRADEQLLVNTHIYGMAANNAPVFHLRKIPGGDTASSYLESFERVWDGATPCEGK